MHNNMLEQTTEPMKRMSFRNGANCFFFVLLILMGTVLSSVASPLDEEPESCRQDVLNKWLETTNNPIDFGTGIAKDQQPQGSVVFDVRSLQTIRETPLFETIAKDCSYFVEEFNAAAGATCVLQNLHRDFSYSEFWYIGPINMDGEWLLAADLLLSNNLEDALPLVPCADSCYKRNLTLDVNDGSDGDCHEFATAGPSFLEITSITTIDVNGLDPFEPQEDPDLRSKQRTLCDLGWLDADKAYQNLRSCAAESNVARTMVEENDESRFNENINNNNNYSIDSERIRQVSAVARAYEAQRQKQASCASLSTSPTGMCALHNSTRDDLPDIIPKPDFGEDDMFMEVSNSGVTTSARASIATMGIAATTGMLLFLLLFEEW